MFSQIIHEINHPLGDPPWKPPRCRYLQGISPAGRSKRCHLLGSLQMIRCLPAEAPPSSQWQLCAMSSPDPVPDAWDPKNAVYIHSHFMSYVMLVSRDLHYSIVWDGIVLELVLLET